MKTDSQYLLCKDKKKGAKNYSSTAKITSFVRVILPKPNSSDSTGHCHVYEHPVTKRNSPKVNCNGMIIQYCYSVSHVRLTLDVNKFSTYDVFESLKECILVNKALK